MTPTAPCPGQYHQQTAEVADASAWLDAMMGVPESGRAYHVHVLPQLPCCHLLMSLL